MLPTYARPGGATDEASNRMSAPLLAIRKARANDPPAWGLLVLTAACCLLIVIQLWFSSSASTWPAGEGAGGDLGSRQRRALAVARRAGTGAGLAAPTFPAPSLRNLVLVACHSVYTGLDFHEAEEPSSWYLLGYQKEVPGQTHSFVEHIKIGVKEAAADQDALLLFSGGKTRRDAGPRAEGEGYWLVAEASKWWGNEEVRDRAFTEDRARDSFENLLFGLCRFNELTGRYPEFIVVVGYEFKRRRFSEVHRAALRLPQEAFRYEGTPALNAAALVGEQATVAAFEADPYGCHGELAAKRQQRDPFSVGGYTGDRCLDMAELLQHCGPQLYDGPLPWDGTT